MIMRCYVTYITVYIKIIGPDNTEHRISLCYYHVGVSPSNKLI
jgi:hypothetical protein